MTDLAFPARGQPALRATPRQPTRLGHLASVAMVGAATWAAVLTELQVHIPNLSLVFVLPVVAAAVSFGWGPSLTAAVGGVVCYNFFLIEPRHTFRVAEPSNVWALALLMLVAAMVSALAAQSRRQATEALEHVRRARALQNLSRALTAAPDRDVIAQVTAQGLHDLFKAPAVVLAMGGLEPELAAAPEHQRLEDADLEAAELAVASRRTTRADAFPTGGARFDFWPVVTPGRRQAALGVEARDGDRPDEGGMQIVSDQLGAALDREAYAREAAKARLEAESERLKTDLLAAVSHELRTPLATILVTLQSLQRFGEAHDPAAQAELLALAEVEISRLARLVNDLLDMSRIEAGAVAVRLQPTSPRLLIACALERAAGSLNDVTVVDETPADLPAVLVDTALAETALANVLENAGKYGRTGGVITVTASQQGSAILFEVSDQGPGFPEAAETMFEKFTRGVEGDGRPPGAGLGLSIARGLLQAQGGDIEARNRAGESGAVVRLRLPTAEGGV